MSARPRAPRGTFRSRVPRCRIDEASGGGSVMRLEIYPGGWGRGSEADRNQLFGAIAGLREVLGVVVGRGYAPMETMTWAVP